MKIRMKFTKQGNTKFVGHLDTVRLFQRALKIAKVPIAYSQGVNPHSLIYFVAGGKPNPYPGPSPKPGPNPNPNTTTV